MGAQRSLVRRAWARLRPLEVRAELLVQGLSSRLGHGTRPGFLILGAQKSGTSALQTYLRQHEQVRGASRKEIHYFDHDPSYARGPNYYHSFFPLPSRMRPDGVTFDATSNMLYHAEAPARIHAYDPDLRMVAVLRDPVTRAYSHWNMYRDLLANPKGGRMLRFLKSRQSEDTRAWVERVQRDGLPGFAKVVREELDQLAKGDPAPEPSFVRRGLYMEQIERYLRFFSREQLYFVDSGTLRSDTENAMQGVAAFLGLRPIDWSTKRLSRVHARGYPEPIAEDVRQELEEFYRGPNEELARFLGHPLSWSPR